MFTHILLEVYCRKNYDKDISRNTETFCKSKNHIPEYSCLLSRCPYVEFTSHENALCYVNQDSEAEEIISLGGEMYIDEVDELLAKLLWEKIAKQKIDEAYRTYMTQINKIKQKGKTDDGSLS